MGHQADLKKESRRRMDSNDVHGYCLDCGKKFSDKWMYANPFAQNGDAPACNLCGGVVAVMEAAKSKKIIEDEQYKRGIGREARPTVHDWERAGERHPDSPKVPTREDDN